MALLPLFTPLPSGRADEHPFRAGKGDLDHSSLAIVAEELKRKTNKVISRRGKRMDQVRVWVQASGRKSSIATIVSPYPSWFWRGCSRSFDHAFPYPMA